MSGLGWRRRGRRRPRGRGEDGWAMVERRIQERWGLWCEVGGEKESIRLTLPGADASLSD
jgi:hypothetical protein